MNKVESENRTIMFLDLVGYTRITSHLSREKVTQLHNSFDSLSLPSIKSFKGEVIKKLGDGFLVTFKSATNALLCAQELVENFRLRNKGKSKKERLLIKITVHSGEVVLKEGDIYGDAVNITSRIQRFAKPDSILFTTSVSLAMNKNEISYQLVGKKKIKGIKQPIRLFKVISKRKKHIHKVKRGIKTIFWNIFKGTIVTLIILALIFLFYTYNGLL